MILFEGNPSEGLDLRKPKINPKIQELRASRASAALKRISFVSQNGRSPRKSILLGIPVILCSIPEKHPCDYVEIELASFFRVFRDKSQGFSVRMYYK